MTTRGVFMWGSFTTGSPAPAIPGWVALDAQGASVEYPVTANGTTAGITNLGGGTVGVTESAGWAAGDDARVRMIGTFPFFGEGTAIVRLDLPAGEHDLRFGIGGRTYYESDIEIRDSDNTTVLYSNASLPAVAEPAPTQFTAINGALVAYGDVMVPPSIRRTVTGGSVYLHVTAPAGAFRNAFSFFSATSTAVPAADTIRFQGGASAPWSPAAGPTVGTPYTFTLEAWDSALGARDTAITGSVTLGIDFVAGDNVIVQSGPTSVAWIAGLATFTDVVFAEVPAPPPFDPRIPGGGRNPGDRAGLARFLAQNPKLARALRTGKNPKGR